MENVTGNRRDSLGRGTAPKGGGKREAAESRTGIWEAAGRRRKRSRKTLSLMLAFAMILSMFTGLGITASATADDWNGGMNMNSANNQITATALPISAQAAAEQWSAQISTGGTWGNYSSTFVIADGYLYILDTNSTLYRIDTADGSKSTTTLTDAEGYTGWYFNYMIQGGGYLYLSSDDQIQAFQISGLNWSAGAVNTATWTAAGSFGNYRVMQYLTCGTDHYIWCNGTVLNADTGAECEVYAVDGTTPFADSFGWSSGAVAGDFFYVTGPTGIYAFRMTDWTLADSWEYLGTGDTSSTSCTGQTAYDSASSRLFWGAHKTKKIFSIKIDGTTGKFVENSGISAPADVAAVTAPVVYNNTVYLAGQTDGAADQSVADVFDYSAGYYGDTLSLRYAVSTEATDGKTITTVQSTPVLSTAYAGAFNDNTVYLYLQPNMPDGNLYVLEDSKTAASGQLKPVTEVNTGDSFAYAYEPFGLDGSGNLYFYNEHGVVYCWGFTADASGSKNSVETPVFATNLGTAELKYAPDEVAPALSATVTAPAEGELSYQWQVSGNRGVTYSDISGATETSYTPSEQSGTRYYRLKVTNTHHDVSAIAYSNGTPVTWYSNGTASVKVTLAVRGTVPKGTKTGTTDRSMWDAPVTVSDLDRDGFLTVEDTLRAFHVAYSAGGAADYASASGFISRLWGQDTSSVGYYHNDTYVAGTVLTEAVADEDTLKAYIYQDDGAYSYYGYGDVYTYFDPASATATAKTAKAFMLKGDSWGSPAIPAGAKIRVLDSTGAEVASMATVSGTDGGFSLTFPAAGNYTVLAESVLTEDTATATGGYGQQYYTGSSVVIVPSRCAVSVTSGGGGGSITAGSVYLTVNGPDSVLLKQKKIGFSSGMTAFDILDQSGLTVESKYSSTNGGYYVQAIGGHGEFDEGEQSGWLYSVNGKKPGVSASAYSLSSGDKVIWYYSKDGETAMYSPAGGSGSGVKTDEDSGQAGTGDDEADGAAKAAERFSDVAASVWYAASVDYCYEQGLLKGLTDTEFGPDETMSRAMLVTAMYRMAGSPAVEDISGSEIDGDVQAGTEADVSGSAVNGQGGSSFGDVNDSNAYYYDAVRWAAKNGIVDGLGNGLFGPDQELTRQQMVTIFYRYAVYKGSVSGQVRDLAGYADAARIGDWAEEAFQWAVGTGLVNGTSATELSPEADGTRAQLAAILARFVEIGSKEQ